MIDTIKNFIELILDKSKRWTYKVAIIISLISILFILDFVFKISYNHHISNKLQNLEKVQILKKEFASHPKKLKKILEIENEIFYEKHYSDYIQIKDISFSNPFAKKKSSVKNLEKVENRKDIRSYSWMFVSSSFVFIIIIIALLFMIFKEAKSFKSILNWFSTLILFLLLSIFSTWVAYQIPLIFGFPLLNYIFNFIIHCSFIYALTKLNDKYNIR